MKKYLEKCLLNTQKSFFDMYVVLRVQSLFYEKKRTTKKMNHKRIYVMINNKHDLHTTRCEIT